MSGYYTNEEWNETPAERAARFGAERNKKLKRIPSVPKGTCPKCFAKIGKGIHFHVKACKK